MSDTKLPFERLLAHAAWVRGLARSLLSDPNEVDDVVQETWVAALEHPEVGSPPRNQRAWLGGVFRNVVRQSRRSAARRRRRETEAARPEGLPAAAELVEQADLQRRIIEAVIELHEPYRSTLLMRFFEELSAEEIARRLDVPASTVRNRQKRGLELLRERFDRGHDGDRRAWCLELIPIAIPKGSGAASVATAATTVGVWTMNMQLLAVTASVALIGWGASLVFDEGAGNPVPMLGQTGQAEALSVVGAINATVGNLNRPDEVLESGLTTAQAETQDQEQEGSRRPVPVVEPKHVLRGRVVDTEGEPVSGARVFVGARPSPFEGPAKAGLQLMYELEDDLLAHQVELDIREREVVEREKQEQLEDEAGKNHDESEARKRQAREDHTDEKEKQAQHDRELEEQARRLVDELQREEDLVWLEHVSAERSNFQERPLEALPEWIRAEVEHLESRAVVLGKYVVTDAEGRFQLEFEKEIRVYVTVEDRPGVHKTHVGAWHTVPAEDVTLTVQRVPTATVAVWLTDSATGERVSRWVGVLHRNGVALEEWDSQGRVEQLVEIPEEKQSNFSVTVRQPQWAHTKVEFQLTPDAHRDVEILVDSGEGLRGSVVDTFGQPLAGAFVYWGVAVDMRGDTIFGNYDPERVFGGVKTDATGHFRLPGEADWVSAWHPEHSPATVEPNESSVIQLAARGHITGTVPKRLLESQEGELLAVHLDRAERQAIDDTGSFSFPNVEAGVHGISIGERWFTGVNVKPGETVHLTWEGPLTEAKVEVYAGDAAFRGEAHGYYVGLDRIFTLDQFILEAEEGQDVSFVVEGQRLGSYVLYTDRHQIAFFELNGTNHAIADMGSASLMVRGAPGRVVYLVPEHLTDNPLVVRVASIYPREIPDSGELVLEPLPAGSYAVYDPHKGIVARVNVQGIGAVVTLP